MTGVDRYVEFALRDVMPNPFRDLSRYTYLPEKLDKLTESIQETTFWENVVGRLTPQGKLEIAYGHHRIKALLDMYGPEHKAYFIVRDLPDSQMLKMLARENDETYRGDLRATIESVRAMVQGLAAKRVKPEELSINKHTDPAVLRYAPSYITGVRTPQDSWEVAYTDLAVARYLGSTCKKGKEPAEKITAALYTLELTQLGIWNDKTLDTFKDKRSGVVIVDTVLNAARDTRKRAEHSLAKSKLQVTEATAAIKAGQAQLEAVRQENAKRRAAYDAEVERLADLAEEDDKATADRKEQERKEREAREKANAAEFKRKEKESNDRVEAAEKRRVEAQKAAEAAAAKQALANKPPKGSEPKPTFFPELTAGLDLLKVVRTGKCIGEVRKVPMTAEQKKTWKATLNDTAAFLTAEAKRY